jgi:hypothetical protein
LSASLWVSKRTAIVSASATDLRQHSGSSKWMSASSRLSMKQSKAKTSINSELASG